MHTIQCVLIMHTLYVRLNSAPPIPPKSPPHLAPRVAAVGQGGVAAEGDVGVAAGLGWGGGRKKEKNHN